VGGFANCAHVCTQVDKTPSVRLFANHFVWLRLVTLAARIVVLVGDHEHVTFVGWTCAGRLPRLCARSLIPWRPAVVSAPVAHKLWGSAPAFLQWAGSGGSLLRNLRVKLTSVRVAVPGLACAPQAAGVQCECLPVVRAQLQGAISINAQQHSGCWCCTIHFHALTAPR